MSTSNDSSNNASAGKCPFHTAAPTQSAGGGTANRDWWPNQLRVDLLNQHSSRSNPLGEEFNYREEFKKARLLRAKSRPESPANRLPGVVAGRLGQLHWAVYSYGIGTVPVPTVR
ncbi:Catalase-peroxidase [Raoultella terrigena]|uniref:Catalase-peroxidase n=1 Tax=Raoultella terrigena TaxID=577 RepID=A0A3P8IYZ2_RAOTE|nr:Catalase-peroxidase [Raoultella terrigena]